jgi:SAM-dependent methyltransferase
MDFEEFERLYKKYLSDVKSVTTETNKSYFFIELVRNTFRKNIDNLERVFPQMEKFVKFKGKTIALKGEIDSLLGNIIIEFESDIKSKKIEAENQLKRYVSILWNNELQKFKRKVNYIVIATDGIFFYVYRPETIKEEEITENDVTLIPIDEFNIEKRKSRDVLIWLDITFLSKELKIPTTEEFKSAFGVGTTFYKDIMNMLHSIADMFEKESKLTFDTIFSEWSKYLSIAYGSSIESKEFFIKHTYLSLLAKLMIYSFFSKGVVPVEETTIYDILKGKEFQKWGIRNFFEEDFFSWIIREPVKDLGIQLSRTVLHALSKYDLTKLNEDILKGLYENLLDQRERHDLGEVYTPDWLVEYILRNLLQKGPEKSLLDPACGSGTFLFIAIKLKKEFLKKKMNELKLLYHILENVKGIDIHPLAVLIAKTNYILALGDLLKTVGRREVVLPIYMADSIRLIDEDKTSLHGLQVYKIPTVDDKTFFFIPADFIEKERLEPEKIDALIDLMKDLSLEVINNGKVHKDAIAEFLYENLGMGKKVNDYVEALSSNVTNFANIIKNNRDTIWSYILKNKHKPIDFTYRKFDLVVGNPPWLVYNAVKNIDYQQFLKKQITNNYNLTTSAELITHMELATLFYLRCSELYLSDNGTIAFVMPRSIFSADQHSSFRNNSFKRVKLGFYKIFDLEKVKPLFNIPACVVFANKNKTINFPIDTEIFSGNLRIKNETYENAVNSLKISTDQLVLSKIGTRDFLSYGKIEFKGKSWYYDKFYQGATIVPQTFWYVETVKSEFGFAKEKPYVKTSKQVLVNAKKPWDAIIFEGNIESEYIFDGITSSNIFPFCYRTNLVVLPIVLTKNGFTLLRRNEILSKSPLLSKWLEKAERLWKEKRGEKQKFDIYQWINYNQKLSRQNPTMKFKVVYNETGKDLVSSVIETQRHKGKVVFAKGTIYFETDNVDEAYYLTAVLNSPLVNQIIKPMQAKGLFGERGIEKKVLEIPIPKFNSKNKSHQRLSELGKLANKKAQRKLDEVLKEYENEVLKPQHIARIRKEIRDYLKSELEEINELVQNILKENSSEKIGILNFVESFK